MSRLWPLDPFDFLLSLTFDGGTVSGVRDVLGQEIPLARLEPVAIGGIYPANNEDRVLVRLSEVPRHLIQALIATASESRLGSRESSRLSRHISHCQPCRREAMAAGLDSEILTHVPLRRRAAHRSPVPGPSGEPTRPRTRRRCR